MKKNIIWILCDSVRVYKTDSDERGRLDVMDTFAKESVDFRTAVTAAPSTVMSISSMITGIPAPYQSMSYNDFSFLDGEINSFPNILRSNGGYDTYGMFFWPDGRKFLGPIWGDICEKYWDKDLKSRKDEFWSNDDQIRLFKRFIKERSTNTKPFFSWLHLNCRNDAELSQKVDSLFAFLKLNNLWDDYIIVLNSDHGYPDVNRGISYYDKLKYGHDLIMSDDNILAPQLLKLPGISARKVDEVVSTLDIAPTILDYLGLYENLDLSSFISSGRSLLNDLKNGIVKNNDFCRVDNRFLFQRNCVTVLRNNRYKFIKYVDENREEFYDIYSDKFEVNNSILKPEFSEKIEAFRNEYINQNKEITNFHVSRIIDKLDSLSINNNNAYFLGDNTIYFCNIMKGVNPLNNLSVNTNLNNLQSLNDFEKFIKNLLNNQKPNNNEILDLFVFPVSKDNTLNSLLERNSKLLKIKKVKIHLVDYNFNPIKSINTILYKKLLTKPRHYYSRFKYDPKSALFHFYLDIKKLIKIIFN